MSYLKRKGLFLILGFLLMGGCNQSCNQKKPTKGLKTPAESAKEIQKNKPNKKKAENYKGELMNDFDLKDNDTLVAEMKTSEGTIKLKLFWDKVPMTVKNFTDLATGKKEWVDPKTSKSTQKPLYDGTIFHRVIDNFMVQGGDPMGTGTGGPGYRFKDEFHKDLKHDKKGVLSMANAGPNTNGSQFFITQVPTPWLDNRHSVFGECLDEESFAIVDKIAKVDKNERDKPLKDVVLQQVKIYKK